MFLSGTFTTKYIPDLLEFQETICYFGESYPLWPLYYYSFFTTTVGQNINDKAAQQKWDLNAVVNVANWNIYVYNPYKNIFSKVNKYTTNAM